MVGARLVVRADLLSDHLRVAPANEVVHQAVGTTTREVFFFVADGKQIPRGNFGSPRYPVVKLRATSRAAAGSRSSTTVTSGASSGPLPRMARALAVCDAGTKYGCAPAARSRRARASAV